MTPTTSGGLFLFFPFFRTRQGRRRHTGKIVKQDFLACVSET